MFDIPKDIGRLETLGRESSYLKPYLLHALDSAPSTHPLVAQARAVLEAWNGNVVADAITSTEFELGHVIFWVWQDKMRHGAFGDELGASIKAADTNMLLHILDGANSALPPGRDYFNGTDSNAVIVRSLEQALDSLTSLFGTADMSRWIVPRGDIVFQHPLGIELGRIPLSNRATYAQVVLLSQPRIVAYNIIPLGQSAFISPEGTPDPHATDQLPLYRNFQYKLMHFFENVRLDE